MTPFVRTALTLAMPLILIWAFVAELVRGIGSAFRSAWLEVRINIETYHHYMQQGDEP